MSAKKEEPPPGRDITPLPAYRLCDEKIGIDWPKLYQMACDAAMTNLTRAEAAEREVQQWKDAAALYVAKNQLDPQLVENPRGLMSELCCCDLNANAKLTALSDALGQIEQEMGQVAAGRYVAMTGEAREVVKLWADRLASLSGRTSQG